MIQKEKKSTRRKAAPRTPAAAVRTDSAPAKPAAKTAAPATVTATRSVADGRPAAVPRQTTAPAVPSPAAVAAIVVKNRSEAPAAKPVSAEERGRMIAEAAYFRAQHRGFQGGDPVRDWAEAEAEIDAMLLHRG